MVSSMRPQEKGKKPDEGNHGNVPKVTTRPSRQNRYSQSEVSRLTCVLVVINTLLFVMGAAGFSFSIIGLIRYKTLGYEEIFKDVTIVTIAPWVAVVSSTMAVVMVPLYGCYGAVSQRKNCLVMFFLFLLLMLLLDLVMCLWAVTTADKIRDDIEAAIRAAVSEYYTDSYKQNALDDLHTYLGCCGSDEGVRDFGIRGPPWSCTNTYIFEHYLQGCNVKMHELYKEYRFIAMGVFGALAVVLMVTMIVVLLLLEAIRKRKPPERPPDPPPLDRVRPDVSIIETSSHGPTPGKVASGKSRPSSRMSLGPPSGSRAVSPTLGPTRPTPVPTPRGSGRSNAVLNIGNSNEISVV